MKDDNELEVRSLRAFLISVADRIGHADTAEARHLLQRVTHARAEANVGISVTPDTFVDFARWVHHNCGTDELASALESYDHTPPESKKMHRARVKQAIEEMLVQTPTGPRRCDAYYVAAMREWRTVAEATRAAEEMMDAVGVGYLKRDWRKP